MSLQGVSQHYQDFRQRNQVDSECASGCVYLNVCGNVWRCVSLRCYTWDALMSVLDWSDTPCCELNSFLVLLFMCGRPEVRLLLKKCPWQRACVLAGQLSCLWHGVFGKTAKRNGTFSRLVYPSYAEVTKNKSTSEKEMGALASAIFMKLKIGRCFSLANWYWLKGRLGGHSFVSRSDNHKYLHSYNMWGKTGLTSIITIKPLLPYFA